MSRKMYFILTLRVIVQADDDIFLNNVVDNINVEIETDSNKFDVLDYNTIDYELIDSK
ncbi:MAG TPA: hypothetical protein P5301_07270 [Bacteroidales bacterium]|nr:hypothetical protein [Bacteroidales bacterium]